jgi:uncharacterized membrane protein
MRLALVSASLLALAACHPVASDSNGGGAQEPASAAEEPAGAPADAPKQSLAGVDLNEPLGLVGTEPFWALAIAPDELRLSGADRPDRTAPNKGPALAGDSASWSAETADGTALKVTLTARACADGMSDRRYPLTARVEIGAETLKGCAAPSADLQAAKP